MDFKKSYFDSSKQYNQQKSLYTLRDSLPISSFLQRKSKQHHNLLLLNKWKLFKGCKKVLDAGCGKGEFLELNPYNAEVYGVDIIEDALAASKTKGINVRFADLNKKIPFIDSSFDGINCSHVLEHLEDGTNTISEFKRVLKDKGILVISVPNFSFKKFYSDYTHKRPYPKEALFRILNDNGFCEIKIINGVCLNQLLSATFLLFPSMRFAFEKFFGIFSPWEIIAIARNKK
jgi:SAM-dependent methyltransferase